uniref:Uncharacterized protein n=1 Tax=Helicotheca tamesis TaxID=374047 RepID=A0A7S2N096_9STRA
MSPSPCLRVYPGQKLRLVLLHPSDSTPQLKLQAGDEHYVGVIPCKQADGWEIVSPISPQVTQKLPLCHPNGLRALRHLPMLEPAYAKPGSVHHPPSTATDRTAVTLKTSILGQIVAPSVTKSIAVVELDSNKHLEPVPEHRRPEPVSFKEVYPKSFLFYGEMEKVSPSPFGGGFGGNSSTQASGGLFGTPSPALFGTPAPAPASPFAAPAPAPFGTPTPAPTSPFAAPTPGPAGSNFSSPGFGFDHVASSTAQQHTGSVGFKVTKPSLGKKNTVPNIIGWIHSTRGGMYPADAKRFDNSGFSSSSEGKRLNNVTVRDYLRNCSSLPNSQLLRAIECTITLFPDKTGSLSSFGHWVSKYKSDTSALISVGLVCQDIISAGGLALSSSPVFPWQASDTEKIIAKDIIGHKASSENPDELAKRKKFLSVINTSVRRDVYNILINPTHPNKGADPSSMKGDGLIPFGAALLAKASGGKEIDTFAFVDREMVVGSLPDEYQVLDDSNVIDAISNMGGTHPCALAVLETFEDYLKGKAETWTDQDISLLSVEFLVAFGRELTERLDIHHRIRSKKLSNDEILLLQNEPYSLYVNQDMLRAFQDGSARVYEKLSK